MNTHGSDLALRTMKINPLTAASSSVYIATQGFLAGPQRPSFRQCWSWICCSLKNSEIKTMISRLQSNSWSFPSIPSSCQFQKGQWWRPRDINHTLIFAAPLVLQHRSHYTTAPGRWGKAPAPLAVDWWAGKSGEGFENITGKCNCFHQSTISTRIQETRAADSELGHGQDLTGLTVWENSWWTLILEKQRQKPNRRSEIAQKWVENLTGLSFYMVSCWFNDSCTMTNMTCNWLTEGLVKEQTCDIYP